MIKKHILKQAIRKAGEKVHLTESDYIEKILDIYLTADMEDTFRQMPSVWLPAQSDHPRRNAKEIALEAAIELIGDKTLDLTGSQITVVAETLYQWLIKKDDNG